MAKPMQHGGQTARPADVNSITLTSLKDSAYRQAGATQTIETVARFVLDHAPGFPETVTDEVKRELYDGYRMKFNELSPPVNYIVLDGNYLDESTVQELPKRQVERVSIGVEFCYAYSQQEFGKMKDTNPALHAIIKIVREKCATYCSNRLGDLKRTAKKIMNGGKSRERTANMDFRHFVDNWLTEIAPTRLKSAAARHDSSADVEVFNKSKAAFLAVWAK